MDTIEDIVRVENERWFNNTVTKEGTIWLGPRTAGGQLVWTIVGGSAAGLLTLILIFLGIACRYRIYRVVHRGRNRVDSPPRDQERRRPCYVIAESSFVNENYPLNTISEDDESVV